MRSHANHIQCLNNFIQSIYVVLIFIAHRETPYPQRDNPRPRRPLLLPLILAALALPLTAQQWIGRRECGQWVEGRMIGFEFATKTTLLLDDRDETVGRIPPPAAPTRVPAKDIQTQIAQVSERGGTSYRQACFIQDAWHSLGIEASSDRDENTLTFWRKDPEGWKLLGTQVRPFRHGIPQILPYGRGRYLFVGKTPLPQGAYGPWSPFQVFRVDGEGRFQFEEALPHQIEGIKEEDLADEMFFARHAFTQDHLVLLLRPGFLYTFDLKKGKPGLFRHLYGNGKAWTYPKETPFLALGLDLLPCPDGTVCVSGRSRDAAKAWSGEAQVEQPLLGVQEADRDRLLDEAMNLALKRDPYLLWWELDAEQGRLRSLDTPPPGGKEKAASLPELLKPSRVLSDGHIRVGPPPAPVKATRPAAPPTTAGATQG